MNDGTWTYEWQHGRQLASMESDERLIEFKYDHNGMRVEKKVTDKSDNTVETTKYVYHGKKLMEQQKGADVLHFYYDAEGRPAMVMYDGAMYTYVHSYQGDIVGIVDNAGNMVVQYKYDAWGKPLSTAGSMADTLGKRNPFRYRGYVLEEESALYYTNSRYYFSNWNRFINADSTSFLNISKSVLSENIFAYCSNTPICYSDPSGHFFISAMALAVGTAIALVSGAVGAGMGALGAAASDDNVALGALGGFVNGVIGAVCGLCLPNVYMSLVIGTFAGCVADMAVQALDQYLETGEVDIYQIDGERALKTGMLTGVGTLVPAFGKGYSSSTDALGTMVLWSEATVLIASADLIVSNRNPEMSMQDHPKDSKKKTVSCGRRSQIMIR